jgi:hypothetical protein
MNLQVCSSSNLQSEYFAASLGHRVRSQSPWDVWSYDPTIHLVLFVHRVEGLEPGVYFLFRKNDPDAIQKIKDSTDPTFLWESIPNGDALPLFLLE